MEHPVIRARLVRRVHLARAASDLGGACEGCKRKDTDQVNFFGGLSAPRLAAA